MKLEIVPLGPGHWKQVREIYLEGIATGQATFETTAPTWSEWDSSHLTFGRLVAISQEGEIVGWAALSQVSTRLVYAGVSEVSVYVALRATGQGVGKKLLASLVQASEANGIWTLQASVFPENVASIRLHQSCGFREVGIRRRIGRLKGVWRDTMLLERRSRLTGSD